MIWDVVRFFGHMLVGVSGSLIVALGMLLVGELNAMSIKLDKIAQIVYDLRADVRVLQDRSQHK